MASTFSGASFCNRSLITCKGILPQYLFFCFAGDAYGHTVGFLVWSLCISFSQWTKWRKNNCKDFFNNCFELLSLAWQRCPSLRSWEWQFVEHGSQNSVAIRLRCGGIVNDDNIANLLPSVSVKAFWKSVNIWQTYGQDYGDLFFDSHCI